MLTFGGVVELIKCLPQLTIFKLRGLKYKGRRLRSLKSSKYLQFLINKHHLPSQELKEIHVDNLSEKVNNNVVRPMAPIAILCSNLQLPLPNYPLEQEIVQGEWDKLLIQEGFKDYAEWLEPVVDVPG